MQRVQEEATEKALRLMVRVPRLSARLLIIALDCVYRKLESKEPVGKTNLDKLMRGGNKIETTKVTAYDANRLDADMKVFDKLARQFKIGYSIHKISDQQGYVVFFRTKQLQQVAELLNEFNKYKFYKDFKMPEQEQQRDTEDFSKDSPLRGEYAPDRSIVVGGERAVRKPDITINTAITLKRKEPLVDRMERAQQIAKAKVAERHLQRGTRGFKERGSR